MKSIAVLLILCGTASAQQIQNARDMPYVLNQQQRAAITARQVQANTRTLYPATQASTQPASTQPIAMPDNIKVALARSEQYRLNRMQAIRKQITVDSARMRNEAASQAAQTQAAIVAERKELKTLENSKGSFVAPMDFQQGSIGTLSDGAPMPVSQVIDASNIIVHNTLHSYWITGVDTAGHVDDEFVHIVGTYIVSGTKQYDSVDGATRTILLIEPIDLSPYLPVAKN